jgi:hypothetical protein
LNVSVVPIIINTTKQPTRATASTPINNRNLSRIATESANIPLHPLQRRPLIQQTSISLPILPDEFFGKGAYDPSSQNEAKTRLQGFEGAQSISSNAYFGRPEDEEGAGGVEDYGDLETAAKDFVRKFGITAGDDLENLSSMLGEGATKLQGAIRNYLNN